MGFVGITYSYEDIVEVLYREPHYMDIIDYMIIEEMNKDHDNLQQPDNEQ